ncbi:MAG TPA: MoxR family ATPase [Clostridiaceae bacterium]
MEINEVEELGKKIKNNIEKVIVGKASIIDILITALIAGGHVLLEDVPGTGKTVLAKTLAKSIGVTFKRVQFTPDLLPSDLTGINYFNQKEGEFVLRRGPVFTNILLSDEINRATPRTQSSLLECMEEKQVTIDGVTYGLEAPFFVIATQNPVETQGTFPLPEAQLDRFLIKTGMGYPNLEDGKKILERFILDNPFKDLKSVCTSEEITDASLAAKKVYIASALLEYILRLVEETLNNPSIILGCSPRGSLALMRASQVYAALKGRNYVIPEDIKFLAKFVLAHRLILKDSIKIKGVTGEKIISDILETVTVPTENWKEE